MPAQTVWPLKKKEKKRKYVSAINASLTWKKYFSSNIHSNSNTSRQLLSKYAVCKKIAEMFC